MNGTKGSEQQIRQLRLRALGTTNQKGNQKMFAKSSIKHAGMFWLDLAHDREFIFRLCKGSHTHTLGKPHCLTWVGPLVHIGFVWEMRLIFNIIASLVGGVALGFGWVCWGEVTGSI